MLWRMGFSASFRHEARETTETDRLGFDAEAIPEGEHVAPAETTESRLGSVEARQDGGTQCLSNPNSRFVRQRLFSFSRGVDVFGHGSVDGAQLNLILAAGRAGEAMCAQAESLAQPQGSVEFQGSQFRCPSTGEQNHRSPTFRSFARGLPIPIRRQALPHPKPRPMQHHPQVGRRDPNRLTDSIGRPFFQIPEKKHLA
jgi:hypothetical protein